MKFTKANMKKHKPIVITLIFISLALNRRLDIKVKMKTGDREDEVIDTDFKLSCNQKRQSILLRNGTNRVSVMN